MRGRRCLAVFFTSVVILAGDGACPSSSPSPRLRGEGGVWCWRAFCRGGGAGFDRLRSYPLCPAGHLPLKEGDQAVDGFLPIATGMRSVQPARQPFSPLEGEMSGRTEGCGAGISRQAPSLPRGISRRGLHRSGNGARFSCLSVVKQVARKARPAGRCPDCRPVTRAICALAAFPQPT